MPTSLGVKFGSEFWGEPEALEKQGQTIRYQNSPSKFAEKFAGNFRKIRQVLQKNHPKSALQNVRINMCDFRNDKRIRVILSWEVHSKNMFVPFFLMRAELREGDECRKIRFQSPAVH